MIAKTSQEQPQGEFQCKGDTNGVQSEGVPMALKYLLLYTPLRSKGYIWGLSLNGCLDSLSKIPYWIRVLLNDRRSFQLAFPLRSQRNNA